MSPRFLPAGRTLRWRRVGGLLLGEVELAPFERIHRDAHANHRFVLVVRGLLTEIHGGDTVARPSSTLLFRRANDPRTYQAGPKGAVCLIVDIDDGWFARARQQGALLTRSAEFQGGLLLHLAERLYGEFRLRDEVSRLAIESLVLGVLAEASRVAVSERRGRALAPVWVVQTRAFIDAHFAERLALATLAAMFGVHPVHLARTFRRVYHTTVAAYVREARIDFARRQLIATASPIAAIAAEAGFCDQSHFCRLFRRHFGMSPAEYRVAAGS
jgi:AraC family transcriptional regulator